jgi:ubiquinone/menaquinone biosynthesis C-methylase UbiE
MDDEHNGRRRRQWLGWTSAVGAAGVATGAIIARRLAARARQEAGRLAAVLEIGPGDRVADVGAGKGTFAIELAKRVGPSGRIFATETDPKRLRHLRSAVVSARLPQVSVIEASEGDAGLASGSCDAIALRGVYHHFSRPDRMNVSLRDALRRNGRLVVIDFAPAWFLSTFCPVEHAPANRGGHGVAAGQVIDELRAAGFSLAQRIQPWRGRMYCLVFRRTAS